MKQHERRVLYFIAVVLSLTLLAAPARGGQWLGVQVGGGGFSISFGATNWAVYGSSWSSPNWQMDYHVALSGYGNWVWVEGLGQCWQPWVSVGWKPYTHGRWVATPYGWTWVAYEPWGYFPHHYGHWAMSHYGWVWSPGYTYQPANVTWVTSGGYVGWYPCPPPGWSHAARGYGHGYNHGYRHGHQDGYNTGFYDGYWSGWNDARYATYSEWRHLGAEDLSRHAVTASTVRASAAGAHPRIEAGAPDRPAIARRGIVLPKADMETRTVRVDDRDVTVARPVGVEHAIQRHGGRTVERALAPEGQATAYKRSARSTPSTLPSRDRRTTTERDHDAAPSRSSARTATPGNTIQSGHRRFRGEAPQTTYGRSEVTSRERPTSARTPTRSTNAQASQDDDRKSTRSREEETVSKNTSQRGNATRKTTRRR